MPKTVIVGTEEFELPLQGENPDYGEELTDFFTSIADALTTVQQPNDILRSTAAINNNVTVPAIIPGFSYDTSEVRSINAEFIVKRTTTSPANNLVESGFIEGNYTGSEWQIAIRSIGSAGVEFSINPSGQIEYTSSDLVGSNYTGSIIFRSKVFNENA
jgi:hypothetical protein